MNTNFIEELKWRRMLQDYMPGIEEQLGKEMTCGYIGFDPTADSLGVGNLVQIMTLLHFQKAGHKPYVLIGGATGMVGDPSGKSKERNLLSEEVLQHNINCQKKQLEKLLDFDCGTNSAVLVNNYDWFKNFNFLDFIRDVGKHITVNYMLAKDSVNSRLENGMSFTEFTYQLVQGYDFYFLHQNHNCKIQMGGSDQWGNIVTGVELIRKKNAGEAFAITTPLLVKGDGTKFGKTESGNVWLDPAKTSPFQFYQFWLNSSDVDASNYIRIFTLLEKSEIESLEEEQAKSPHLRVLQKALAKDITIRVHSKEEFEMALETSEILFEKGTSESLKKLSTQDFLAIMEGVPQMEVSKSELENGINVVEFLSEKTTIFSSKGNAKKMIQGGGVSINKEKINDLNCQINTSHLINSCYVLVQKGKKNYYLVNVL